MPDIAIYETIGHNADRHERMLDLYAELFPYYAYYLPYMRHRMQLPIDADPNFTERWWLIEVDGNPAGVRLFKYSPGRDCGLSLGIAIKPEYRHLSSKGYARLAEQLLADSQEHLRADARAAGKPTPIGMVTELQVPETTADAAIKRGRARLIERYHEYGYIDLPVEYYEPPFIQGKEEVLVDPAAIADRDFLRLKLGIFPCPGGQFDLNDADMVSSLTCAFLVDHYGLPEDHWVVRRALESIRQHYEEATL